MMNCKRKAAAFALAAILCCSLAAPFGSAATNPSVVIDGKPVQFSESMGAPFVDSNNRTQVPLRAAMEAMGAKVDWDGDVRTAVVSKGSVTVRVPIGAEFVWINGEKKTNDTAALIKDSRTYLPIRIVAEALGADVGWDGNTKTVKITTHGNPVAWVRSGESWYQDGDYEGSLEYIIEGKKVVETILKENGYYGVRMYKYNDRDQLTMEGYGHGPNADDVTIDITKYDYNNLGLISHTESYTELATKEVIPGDETWYEYNSKGDASKILIHHLYDDSWFQIDCSYTYDKTGRMIEMKERFPSYVPGENPESRLHAFRYDGTGRLVEEIIKLSDGNGTGYELVTENQYGYDMHGNLVRQTELSYEDGPDSYPYSYEVRYTYRQI